MANVLAASSAIPLDQIDLSELSVPAESHPAAIPLDQLDVSQLSLPEQPAIPLSAIAPEEIQTEEQYLIKLTPGQLAQREAQAMMQGTSDPQSLQKFEDAAVARRKERKILYDDRRTDEEKAADGAPDPYGWNLLSDEARTVAGVLVPGAKAGLKIMQVGQGMAEGMFSYLNEIGKLVTRKDLMAARPRTDAEKQPNVVAPLVAPDIAASETPGANLTAANKVNLARGAGMLQSFVTNVANFVWRDGSEEQQFREQHRAAVTWRLAEEEARRGKSIFGPEYDVKTDVDAVNAIEAAPIADPSILIPFGVGMTGSRTASLAAATLEKSVAPSVAAQALAKTTDTAAKALRSTQTAIDGSPLLHGIAAAAATSVVGGDAAQAAMAGLLGANIRPLGIAKRTLGGAANSFEKTSQQLLGKIPPGPIGRFSASAYRAVAPEMKLLALGQLYNTPFLLGADTEEEFTEMLTAGVVMSAAGSAAGHTLNGLSISKNYFAAGDRSPEIRLQVKDTGIDPVLDASHQKVVSKLNNASNNFVQAVRDFTKKDGGELYTLDVQDYGSYLDSLVGQQMINAGRPVLITPEFVELTKRQQGVTLQLLGQDGKPRKVALSRVSDTMPGLSVGHEAGHLLENALSPEEIGHIYKKTRDYYGDEQLVQYHLRYEDLVNPERDRTNDPKTWADMDLGQQRSVLSEIFAEHASAAFNSIPIGKFGLENGSKNYAREVYGMLGRGLEKLGVKQPELSPEGFDPTKTQTGTGIEPSVRLSTLIENVIQAKRLDGELPKTVPSQPAPPVIKTEAPAAARSEGFSEPANARPLAPKPVKPGFKKGDPVGDIKNDSGILVGEDAKVVSKNDDGTYDVEYTHPDTGERLVGAVPETALESPNNATPGTKATPEPKMVFPQSPITSKSPFGAPPQPQPSLPVPRTVENTTRPQLDSSANAPAKTPNVRTTDAKQQALAGPASPEVVQQNLATLKAADSKPRSERQAVETDYYSAKSPVASPDQVVREKQRIAADAAEVDGQPNPLRTRYQKIFVPYKLRENSNGSTTTFGMSLDKVAQNLDLFRGWLSLNPEAAKNVDVGYLTSPQIAGDLQTYLTNQSNGYAGDGRALKRPVDARDITPETPGFTPTPLDADKAQVLNLLMGMEQPGRQTAGQDFARRFAELNGVKVGSVAGVSETNALRQSLRGYGFDPRILNAVVENLRVDRMTTPLKVRADLNFPAGDTGFQRAGFMPQVRVIGDRRPDKPSGYSWLTPSGDFWSVDSTHSETAQSLLGGGTDAMDRAFAGGWARVVYSGDELIAHRPGGGTLTRKQTKALTDYAIESGKRSVRLDNDESYRPIWTENDAAYMPSVRRERGNDDTRSVVSNYIRNSGITNEPHATYATIEDSRMKRIADWFDSAKHEPNNPEVKKAYSALEKETLAQYQAMVDAGIAIEPYKGTGEPYANSSEMMADVRDNKHLWFFKTDNGFGEGSDVSGNPLLADSGIKIGDEKLLVNDVFRAVHDYFGHTAEGYEFGPRGEFNAYLAHSRMFSDQAKPALAAETLAQNAWVNFGPQMRDGSGKILRPGDPGYLSQKERKFADQKTTVVPAEILADVEAHGASAKYMPAGKIDSPEFKKWFGDWEDPKALTSRAKGPVSVVMKGRKPMQLIHATRGDFTAFEVGRKTKNSSVFGDEETTRHAIFLAEDPALSNQYVTDEGRVANGARSVPVYASIKAPLDMVTSGFDPYALGEEIGVNGRWIANTRDAWELFDGPDGEAFVSALEKAGYDGVIFSETGPDRERDHTTYAVFTPTQIKSAIGNTGAFDGSNPDIRYMPQTGGFAEKKTAPTGWVLPGGEYIGKQDTSGKWRNDGDFHLGVLSDRAADFEKRFGLKALDPDARLSALKKGFVRVRYDGKTGRMGIEALAPLKGRELDRVRQVVEDNIDLVDRIDLNLFDADGKAVTTRSATLFDKDGVERSSAALAVLKDGRREGGIRDIPGAFEPAYMPAQTKKSLEEAYIGKSDDFWGIAFDEHEGSWFGEPFKSYGGTQCTGYACAIHTALGAARVEVFGFHVNENPTSKIAQDAGGHDFAVVDKRYIVDPWLTDIDSSSKQGVFDLQDEADAAKVEELYGDRSKWKKAKVTDGEANFRPQFMPAPKTDTPEFKKWFGASKVVTPEGTPQVVFHGTDKSFNKFSARKATQKIFWFTSDRSAIEAGEVGAQGKGKVMELYASLQNPAGWDAYGKLGLGELEARGYDGAILPDGDGTFVGFAFESAQLKSATKNVGTFDGTNPDIRFMPAFADDTATRQAFGTEFDRVVSTEGSGNTFNPDGTVADTSKLPIIVTLGALTQSTESASAKKATNFFNRHSEFLLTPNARPGIFNYEGKVSADLNVALPLESLELAKKFAADNRQHSIYNAAAGEVVLTGGSGIPLLNTPLEYAVAARQLSEGTYKSIAEVKEIAQGLDGTAVETIPNIDLTSKIKEALAEATVEAGKPLSQVRINRITRGVEEGVAGRIQDVPIISLDPGPGKRPPLDPDSPEKWAIVNKAADAALKVTELDPELGLGEFGYRRAFAETGLRTDVPPPPEQFARYVKDPALFAKMLDEAQKKNPQLIESALGGLEHVAKMHALARAGKLAPETVAMHMAWGIASRMLAPFDQEGGWIRVIRSPEVFNQIANSIDGEFKMSRDDWKKVVSGAMQDSNLLTEDVQASKVGKNAIANLNAFHLMLEKWNGRWNELTGILNDSELSGPQMRDEFFSRGFGGAGIKHKVSSFVILTLARDDVFIGDRWQVVHGNLPLLERIAKERGLDSPFDYDKNGIPQDRVGIYGAYGPLLDSPAVGQVFYKLVERGMAAIGKAPEVKAVFGKELPASAVHWLSWNIIKNEPVGHSSLEVTHDLLSTGQTLANVGREALAKELATRPIRTQRYNPNTKGFDEFTVENNRASIRRAQ